MKQEQMTGQPSTDGSNGPGRDPSGKFATGNKAGRGNPHAKHVAKLRSALLNAVSEEDIERVVKALLDQALAGDVASIKELLLRVLGKPQEVDLTERLERVEELLREREAEDVR